LISVFTDDFRPRGGEGQDSGKRLGSKGEERMSRRVIVAAVVAVLALGAGVALAATQTTASGGTNVCVNDQNGLVRVAETCRAGEQPLTIGGGGGNAQVTQHGTFTVPWGETGTGKVLPLTGVTVSGRCDRFTPPPGTEGDYANAFLVVEAASGQTMDVFTNAFNTDPRGRASASLYLATYGPGYSYPGTAYTLLTANGATATVTAGASVNANNCVFLWQAIEAVN
jgi:uncharacterized membrane protein